MLADKSLRCDFAGSSNPVSNLRSTFEKCKSQAKITKALGASLLSGRRINTMQLLRKRLARFQTGIPLGIATQRAIARLIAAGKLVPPAAWSVLLKTLLNGWATGRRMRTAPKCRIVAKCLFCGVGDDSLEHYAECNFCKKVCAKCLFPCDGMASFLALSPACSVDIFLKRRIKSLSLLFNIRSHLFHAPVSSGITPDSLLIAAFRNHAL